MEYDPKKWHASVFLENRIKAKLDKAVAAESEATGRRVTKSQWIAGLVYKALGIEQKAT